MVAIIANLVSVQKEMFSFLRSVMHLMSLLDVMILRGQYNNLKRGNSLGYSCVYIRASFPNACMWERSV